MAKSNRQPVVLVMDLHQHEQYFNKELAVLEKRAGGSGINAMA